MSYWRENGDSEQYRKKLHRYLKKKESFQKKHPSKNGVVVLGMFDLLKRPTPPSKVSYNKYGISLHVYGEYNSYDIEWNRIEPSVESIIGWISHLSEKTWCDPMLIRDFVKCVFKHFKLKENEIS